MISLPREDILAAQRAAVPLATPTERQAIFIAIRQVLEQAAARLTREKAVQDQASCTATANIITNRHKVRNQ